MVHFGQSGRYAQGDEADPARGALTIRDIDDDVLIDKEHLWASRKPSSGRCSLPSTPAR